MFGVQNASVGVGNKLKASELEVLLYPYIDLLTHQQQLHHATTF